MQQVVDQIVEEAESRLPFLDREDETDPLHPKKTSTETADETNRDDAREEDRTG